MYHRQSFMEMCKLYIYLRVFCNFRPFDLKILNIPKLNGAGPTAILTLSITKSLYPFKFCGPTAQDGQYGNFSFFCFRPGQQQLGGWPATNWE